MVTEVTRHDVRRLLDQGAQLVDVLPAGEFADAHLPGAINLPLDTLVEEGSRRLDPRTPTIAYCYDSLCDLSPRAAWRLESLGFDQVSDYVASKMDWLGAGLPFEGTRAAEPRLGTLADPTVPTCHLGETTAEVMSRLGGWDLSVVINARRVVLGIVRASDLDGESRPVADVMEEAPRSSRPHVTATEMIEHLGSKNPPWLLISNLDGVLVGVARTREVRAADESAASTAA